MNQLARGASIALIVCFFLPWMDAVFFTLSGYDLVRAASGLADIFSAKMPIEALALLFIPASALLAAVAGNRMVYLVAGSVPLVEAFYFVVKVGEVPPLEALGVGAWGTLVSSFVLLWACAQDPKMAASEASANV